MRRPCRPTQRVPISAQIWTTLCATPSAEVAKTPLFQPRRGSRYQLARQPPCWRARSPTCSQKVQRNSCSTISTPTRLSNCITTSTQRSPGPSQPPIILHLSSLLWTTRVQICSLSSTVGSLRKLVASPSRRPHSALQALSTARWISTSSTAPTPFSARRPRPPHSPPPVTHQLPPLHPFPRHKGSWSAPSLPAKRSLPTDPTSSALPFHHQQ